MLTSDVYSTEDGFYFDDFLVRKIVNTTSVSSFNTVQEDILVYPNPTKNSVHLFSGNNIQSITITDVSGKTLYYQNQIYAKNFQIDLPLSAGVYFMRIETDTNDIFNKKLIVVE